VGNWDDDGRGSSKSKGLAFGLLLLDHEGNHE
jgi:hypothetical protein